MLIGFNNDVEFNSRMFHIQTEDNGIKNASITTILFFQGQILDTKNASYGDLITRFKGTKEEELEGAIKQRMVDLHRTLYKNLFNGMYVENTERILRTKGKATAGKSQPGLKKMPAPAAAAKGSRPVRVPKHTNLSQPQTGSKRVDLSPPPERRVKDTLSVQWTSTGQSAFQGIIWPTEDFRLDGLVAQFIDSQS